MSMTTTIVTGNQRGAPAIKLGGNAAYKPPTASIATSGGQSGSRGCLLFLWILTARVVALLRRLLPCVLAYDFSSSLAWFNTSIAAWPNSSLVASTRSFNCSRLVALAIGAVMLGRAINHASATCAGVD